MSPDTIDSLSQATWTGSLSFPQIVEQLMANGVEYYHVDYATRSTTFYSASGTAVTTAMPVERLPSISEAFDAIALRAAILDSQRHGQKYPAFCERAVCAGVQGYFAFLRGKRVTYFGRNGDHHVEWFPGAESHGDE
jgi:uncharacterized protein YbcV (DUF1398 family)